MLRVDALDGRRASRPGRARRHGLDLSAHRRRGRGRPHRRGHPLLRHVRRPLLPRRRGADGRSAAATAGSRRACSSPSSPSTSRSSRARRRLSANRLLQDKVPNHPRCPCSSTPRWSRSTPTTPASSRRSPCATTERRAPSTTTAARSSSSASIPTPASSRLARGRRTRLRTHRPLFARPFDGVFAAGDVRADSTKQTRLRGRRRRGGGHPDPLLPRIARRRRSLSETIHSSVAEPCDPGEQSSGPTARQRWHNSAQRRVNLDPGRFCPVIGVVHGGRPPAPEQSSARHQRKR